MTAPHSLPLAAKGKSGWPWTEESSLLPLKGLDSFAWPRISIVTPSFNQGQFLEETLRSVLLQGYPNLEYIVVDGGSIDNSVSTIKKYEPWISYWVSEKDKGQTDAICKGMLKATGEIVNWLNSDDLLLPGALFNVAEAYRQSGEEFCVICGSAVTIDSRGERIGESIIQRALEEEKMLPQAPPYTGGIQASWFVSAKAWKAVGGIRMDLDYTMDSDLYYRLHARGFHFTHVNGAIAAYRRHCDTKTLAGWRRSLAFKERMYATFLQDLTGAERRLYSKRVETHLFGLCLRSINPNDSLVMRLRKLTLGFHKNPAAAFSLRALKKAAKCVVFPA